MSTLAERLGFVATDRIVIVHVDDLGMCHDANVGGFEALANGRARSLVEISKAEGVSDRYVGHLIPLAFLAPDIVAEILSGTQPVDLTTETLTKRINLPPDWAGQMALLGFDRGFQGL